jgi:DNA-binding response OmpR family regulator
VVEDDPSSRSALEFLLTRAGCDVLPAENLTEAFAILKQHVPPPIDSIVLDLMLPDGDGATLLQHARSVFPNIRVVVATGVLDADWLDRVQALKPASVLRKPILLAELLRDL